jgi:hypothetical protein
MLRKSVYRGRKKEPPRQKMLALWSNHSQHGYIGKLDNHGKHQIFMNPQYQISRKIVR